MLFSYFSNEINGFQRRCGARHRNRFAVAQTHTVQRKFGPDSTSSNSANHSAFGSDLSHMILAELQEDIGATLLTSSTGFFLGEEMCFAHLMSGLPALRGNFLQLLRAHRSKTTLDSHLFSPCLMN